MAEKKSKGTSKEIYVVREQEDMIQFLLDGGSCILNGPNRIGKDNFYLGIKNRLEEGYQVAYSVEEALNTEAISILELDTNTVRETYPKNGTGTKLPFTRLLGKETGMTVPYIWVFNNFNKVLENEFVDANGNTQQRYWIEIV